MPTAISTMVNIVKDIIPSGKPNRPGTKINVTHITIHNTSNTSAGADAQAHSKFVKNTGYYVLPSGKKNYVSWHFSVDDGSVYQHLPVDERGYHAGTGNSKSLGIEICMNNGIDQAAANLRAATLVAGLLNDLDLSTASIEPHNHWTGKNCPILLLNSKVKGVKWNEFVAVVGQIQNTISAKKGSAKTLAILSTDDLKAVSKARIASAKIKDASGDAFDIDHDKLVLPGKYLTKSKSRKSKAPTKSLKVTRKKSSPKKPGAN